MQDREDVADTLPGGSSLILPVLFGYGRQHMQMHGGWRPDLGFLVALRCTSFSYLRANKYVICNAYTGDRSISSHGSDRKRART
jgi:hypothetical protein